MTRADQLLAAGAATALLVGALAAWSLVADEDADQPAADAPGIVEEVGTTPSPSARGELVVDVEGAVVDPGIHRLAPGDRIADALAAAGGYAADADLAASARQINLAAPIADGQQIYVPRQGEVAVTGGSSTSGEGPLNLNTASPEALEALPGIGPVTVQKILAARAERPFATLDELVERGVLNRGQLEQIRELATVN